MTLARSNLCTCEPVIEWRTDSGGCGGTSTGVEQGHKGKSLLTNPESLVWGLGDDGAGDTLLPRLNFCKAEAVDVDACLSITLHDWHAVSNSADHMSRLSCTRAVSTRTDNLSSSFCSATHYVAGRPLL